MLFESKKVLRFFHFFDLILYGFSFFSTSVCRKKSTIRLIIEFLSLFKVKRGYKENPSHKFKAEINSHAFLSA